MADNRVIFDIKGNSYRLVVKVRYQNGLVVVEWVFSFISMNWRGRPLVSHEVIVNLIGATTTRSGLAVCAPTAVLPKTGRDTSPEEARALLIEMLKFLAGFRHIKTANADLVAERMPLLEEFIQQFLMAVGSLVKRGL